MTDWEEGASLSAEELRALRRRYNEARLEQIKSRAHDGSGRGGPAFDLAVSKIVIDEDSLNFNALKPDELDLIGEGFYGPGMMYGPATRARLRALAPRVAGGPLEGAIFPYPREKLAGFDDLRLAVLANDLRMPAIREMSATRRKKPLQESIKRWYDEFSPTYDGKALAVAILDAVNFEREKSGDKPIALKTVQTQLAALRK